MSNVYSLSRFLAPNVTGARFAPVNDDSPIHAVAEVETVQAEPEPIEPAAPEPEPAIVTGACVVDRDAFAAALAMVKRVVDTRCTIPILANIKLRAGGGLLMVTGTDLDREVTVMLSTWADDSEFEATLPGHLLESIVKKSKAATIDLAASFHGADACVKSGATEYRLQALPVADFPEMETNQFSHRWTMPGKQFRDMLVGTVTAVSKEETRYYLNGVFLHNPNGIFRTAATDGHRLYRMHAEEAPEGSEGMPEAILPSATVDLFLKLTSGKACPARVDVALNDRYFRISFGDVEIVSKLIDGTFPDYQRVIPTGNPHKAVLDASALADAIAAVTVISSERGRSVKLVIQESQCTLAVNNPESGSATSTMACSLTMGEEGYPCVEIGFNARYMLAALADAAPDGGNVTLQLADAGSPTIIRGDRSDWMGVLMPMRV